MNFEAKKNFEKKFFLGKIAKSNIGVPGAHLALKHPRGSQTRTFTRSKILNLYCAENVTYFAKLL